MKTKIWATTAIATLLAAALFSSEAYAQTNIFVRVSGTKGDSTDDKHKDWIDATSLTENIKGGGSASASGKGSDMAVIESFTITKRLDQSSPTLKVNLMEGKHFPEVIIEYWNDSMKFYTITLRDVIITSIRSTVEKGVPMEEVSFAFGYVEWSYITTDSNGKSSTVVKGGWNLKSNTKI